jgi:uncharacterized membrane protein
MNNILTARLTLGEILSAAVRDVRAGFFDLGAFGLAHIPSTPVNFGLAAIVALLVAAAVNSLVRNTSVRVWAFIASLLAVTSLPLLLHDIFFGGDLVYQMRYFTPFYIGAELAVAAFLCRGLFDATSRGNARFLFATIAIAVVGGGILSCAISSEAQTWVNKDYEENRRVASIVNAAHDPVVVSDFRPSRIVSLSYYLDPAVKLRLNLQCDQCEANVPPRELLGGLSRDETIFLLAPSAALERDAERRRLSFQVIDAKTIFPKSSGPLSMFDAVR